MLLKNLIKVQRFIKLLLSSQSGGTREQQRSPPRGRARAPHVREPPSQARAPWHQELQPVPPEVASLRRNPWFTPREQPADVLRMAYHYERRDSSRPHERPAPVSCQGVARHIDRHDNERSDRRDLQCKHDTDPHRSKYRAEKRVQP